MNVRVTHVRVLPGLHCRHGIIQGVTKSLDPLCHSIPEHQSYTSSPGIVQGLPNPLAPTVSEYPRTLELYQQSRDNNSLAPMYHSIPEPLTTLYQSTPECQSCTASPRIIYGLPNTLGPPRQSVLEHKSYTGSYRITLTSQHL